MEWVWIFLSALVGIGDIIINMAAAKSHIEDCEFENCGRFGPIYEEIFECEKLTLFAKILFSFFVFIFLAPYTIIMLFINFFILKKQ